MRHLERSALTLPQHTGCWKEDGKECSKKSNELKELDQSSSAFFGSPLRSSGKLAQKAHNRLKNAPKLINKDSPVRAESLSKEQVVFPKAQCQGCKESDQLQSQKRGQKRPCNLMDDVEPQHERPRRRGGHNTPEITDSSNHLAQCVCEALTLLQHTVCWKGDEKECSKKSSELKELDQSSSDFFGSPGKLVQKARDRLKNSLECINQDSPVRAETLSKKQVVCPKAQCQGCKESDQLQSQKGGRKRSCNLMDDVEPQQKRPRRRGGHKTPKRSDSSNHPAQCVCGAHLKLYDLGVFLGKGAFGRVFAGTRKKDDLPVAIKYVSKQTAYETLEIAGHGCMPIEVALMSLAKTEPSCSSILQILEWYDEPSRYVMILERPETCVDLAKFCRMNGGSLTESVARIVMFQLIDALMHCKMRGIVHRDVKAENILIQTDTLKVKLFDFGCGDVIKEVYKEFAGTLEYMPPEWFKQRRYQADPATVWSVGMTLFKLVCGSLPFKTCKQIKRGRLRIIERLSQECIHLIRWCLRSKAADRPKLEEILLHHWFYLLG